jgi:hypothetical protein
MDDPSPRLTRFFAWVGAIASVLTLLSFMTGIFTVSELKNTILRSQKSPTIAISTDYPTQIFDSSSVTVPSTAAVGRPTDYPTQIFDSSSVTIPPTAVVGKPTVQTSSAIGEIRWRLKDTQENGILDSGVQVIYPEDIVIEKKTGNDGTIFYDKRFMLDSTDFYIGIAIFPDAGPPNLVGFGMFFNRIDVDAFSWEWFETTDTTHATKLQYAGELFFRSSTINSGWDITQIVFLTDTVFRCDDLNDSDYDPNWTVTIFADSYIDWPHYNS